MIRGNGSEPSVDVALYTAPIGQGSEDGAPSVVAQTESQPGEPLCGFRYRALRVHDFEGRHRGEVPPTIRDGACSVKREGAPGSDSPSCLLGAVWI
jgi:hypothetical protein